MTVDAVVERFWIQARIEGNLNRLEAVVGQNIQNTVPPPVWSTSADPVQASADVTELLDTGTYTQLTSVAELDEAGQPHAQVGDLGIVLDGEGRPRALVRTAQVHLADTHADLPGPGPVQVERLELLYPRRRKRRVRTRAAV